MNNDLIGMLLKAWMVLVIAFLFIPICVVILYSFNGGRILFIWEEFSTFWYAAVLDNHRILNALDVSLRSALLNVAISVTLGTVAGIAIARYAGVWTKPFMLLVGLLLVTPELVSAIGQVIWFNRLGLDQGIVRLAIGHSLFNTALVTVIVRARAEGISHTLEEAAGDLGAPPWRSFLQVTLPLMFPAVIAGALLSFTYSFDNVMISLFVQRPGASSLPVYILSSFKAGLRGDVAAVVVMTLGVTIILVVLSVLLLRGGSRRASVL
ncbi:MAG: ABC transporter permease [Stutzerimonas stutzeri]|nr:MAG: ABC transporter permease [Stutzerimonas stutzeri]